MIGFNKFNSPELGLLGINGRNLEYIFAQNPRCYFPNVDDKIKCKKLLMANGVPTPETYYVIEKSRDIRQWQEKLEETDDFVIKPNNSYGGRGILLIKRNKDRFQSSSIDISVDDINFHLREILNGGFSRESLGDKAYFEYKINSAGVFGELLPSSMEGIGDIRIIFQKEEPIMSMLRLPTIESGGRANLHQGGIGIGIDMESGVTLDGCYHNDIILEHPETHTTLTGHKIPMFQQMIDIGKKISDIVGLGYIGVDFAIDKDLGPLVLEVNARPGLNIQIANHDGLRRRLI